MEKNLAMTTRFTPKLLAVFIGLAFVASACGGSKTGHNDADVAFAQQMVPHHTQAVEMATLASSRASNANVKALAKRIEAAQGPEIMKMQGWLKDWGNATETTAMGHSNMTGSSMGDGMMSGADMSKLMKASGADFDRMFLTMMTKHHQGAVAMAKTELAKGKDKDAKALAQSIQESQTKEITEMGSLLTKV
jgi:uncharacterized protein (DUF305 family)